MNLKHAIEYIQREGGVVEQARLSYLLNRQAVDESVLKVFWAGQRDDGGFSPFWAKDYSSLDATCFRLAQAEQLGLGANEVPVQRALDFLERRQRQDGSFEEDRVVAEQAPLWAQPGHQQAHLYLTANCGFWLANLDREDSARRAGKWLLQFRDREGRLPSFLHTHWLASGLWLRQGKPEAAERSIQYLLSRFEDLSNGQLAWMITSLHPAGVPAGHPLLSRSAEQLEQHQAQDGRWVSDDGSFLDPHATLEVLWALRLCGRF